MMRVIRTILVAVFAATILTLWLAVAALWVRSYWRGDVIVVRDSTLDKPTPPLSPRLHSTTFIMLSGNGGIALATRTLSHDPARSTLQIPEKSWNTFTDPIYPKPHSPVAYTFGARNGANRTGRNLNNRLGDPPFILAPTTMGSAFASSIAPPPTPPTGFRQFYAYSTGTHIDPNTDLGDLSRMVIFPWWALQLAMSVPMLWGLLLVRNAIRRLRRARTGFCVRCGYDLRATPDRCPECGLEPAVKVNIAAT